MTYAPALQVALGQIIARRVKPTNGHAVSITGRLIAQQTQTQFEWFETFSELYLWRHDRGYLLEILVRSTAHGNVDRVSVKEARTADMIIKRNIRDGRLDGANRRLFEEAAERDDDIRMALAEVEGD